MRDASIAAAHVTPFGPTSASLRELLRTTAKPMLESAPASPDHIFVASASAALAESQLQLAPLTAQALDLADAAIFEIAGDECAGAAAFHLACRAVVSGQSNCALALGVEKLSSLSDDARTALINATVDAEHENAAGVSSASLYGLLAQGHQRAYGTSRAHLTAVALKNHRNAIHNPIAHSRLKFTEQDLLASPLLADPLRTHDAAPWTDGGAAVLLTPAPRRAAVDPPLIRVAGLGTACAALALTQRSDRLAWRATRTAAARAYAQAACTATAIDVAEVHDSYTIAELLALEALGFCAPGQSGPFTLDGETSLEGPHPINPSGGLLACGHAPAATGLRQIARIYDELRGVGGPLQIRDAQRGLAHNVGGAGAQAFVTILEHAT